MTLGPQTTKRRRRRRRLGIQCMSQSMRDAWQQQQTEQQQQRRCSTHPESPQPQQHRRRRRLGMQYLSQTQRVAAVPQSQHHPRKPPNDNDDDDSQSSSLIPPSPKRARFKHQNDAKHRDDASAAKPLHKSNTKLLATEATPVETVTVAHRLRSDCRRPTFSSGLDTATTTTSLFLADHAKDENEFQSVDGGDVFSDEIEYNSQRLSVPMASERTPRRPKNNKFGGRKYDRNPPPIQFQIPSNQYWYLVEGVIVMTEIEAAHYLSDLAHHHVLRNINVATETLPTRGRCRELLHQPMAPGIWTVATAEGLLQQQHQQQQGRLRLVHVDYAAHAFLDEDSSSSPGPRLLRHRVEPTSHEVEDAGYIGSLALVACSFGDSGHNVKHWQEELSAACGGQMRQGWPTRNKDGIVCLSPFALATSTRPDSPSALAACAGVAFPVCMRVWERPYDIVLMSDPAAQTVVAVEIDFSAHQRTARESLDSSITTTTQCATKCRNKAILEWSVPMVAQLADSTRREHQPEAAVAPVATKRKRDSVTVVNQSRCTMASTCQNNQKQVTEASSAFLSLPAESDHATDRNTGTVVPAVAVLLADTSTSPRIVSLHQPTAMSSTPTDQPPNNNSTTAAHPVIPRITASPKADFWHATAPSTEKRQLSRPLFGIDGENEGSSTALPAEYHSGVGAPMLVKTHQANDNDALATDDSSAAVESPLWHDTAAATEEEYFVLDADLACTNNDVDGDENAMPKSGFPPRLTLYAVLFGGDEVCEEAHPYILVQSVAANGDDLNEPVFHDALLGQLSASSTNNDHSSVGRRWLWSMLWLALWAPWLYQLVLWLLLQCTTPSTGEPFGAVDASPLEVDSWSAPEGIVVPLFEAGKGYVGNFNIV